MACLNVEENKRLLASFKRKKLLKVEVQSNTSTHSHPHSKPFSNYPAKERCLYLPILRALQSAHMIGSQHWRDSRQYKPMGDVTT